MYGLRNDMWSLKFKICTILFVKICNWWLRSIEHAGLEAAQKIDELLPSQFIRPCIQIQIFRSQFSPTMPSIQMPTISRYKVCGMHHKCTSVLVLLDLFSTCHVGGIHHMCTSVVWLFSTCHVKSEMLILVIVCNMVFQIISSKRAFLSKMYSKCPKYIVKWIV